MSNRRLRRALTALCLALLASQASAQTIPGDGKADNPNGSYFVKNSLSTDVRCAIRLNQAGWSPWFTLKANAQLTRFAKARGETLRFQCAPPVEKMAYVLKTGERYAVLPNPGNPAHLVRVAGH